MMFDTKLSKKKETNHFLAAKQEWAEAYGTFIQSRDTWRKVAFGAVAVALLSCTLNIIQITQAKIVPYVIEVDKLGNIKSSGPAESFQQIPQVVIQGTLAKFVSNWRVVTADIGLQKTFIQATRYHVAGSARGSIKEWYGDNNPYERGKNSLVEVRIQGVPMPMSEGGHSWQVEWREITRSRSGVKENEVVYEASLQVQIKPPASDIEILNNPSGVYVTAISWTRKFK